MEARNKLHYKLLVAEKQVSEGAKLVDHNEFMENIRRKINAAKETD